MLDSAIRGGVVSEEDIRRFTLVLADFYRRSEPVPIGAEEYRQRFQRDIHDNHRELSHPDYGIPPTSSATWRWNASSRAKVSVWHLKDHLHPAEQVKWTERGRDYLRLAQRHCEAL